MGNVTFQLKKAQAKSGKSLIYLQFYYAGSKKLVFSFGQNINPSNWNHKKQRVKSNNQTTADGKYSLNDLLDNLEKECNRAYNKEIINGTPDPEILKKHLTAFLNQEESSSSRLFFIQLKGSFPARSNMKGGRRHLIH